jgi:predicted Fe-Mo cluster-binding NifX family protein
MKIVVATDGGPEGKAAAHFAHCSHFVVFHVEESKVKSTNAVENPYLGKHIPAAIPEFVKSLGANVLITGGIGPMAIALLGKMGIEVVYGAEGKATDLVAGYLKGKTKPNENPCDH